MPLTQPLINKKEADTIGVCLFIDAYAAWPKIQSIMIDPYIGMEDEEE